MPTEPRRVEVVCGRRHGRAAETPGMWAYANRGGGYYCPECGGDVDMRSVPMSRDVAPDSLTARMLDLAEAVDRWHALPGDEAMAELLDGESTIVAALAAVRAHPDYVRPE